MKFIIIFVNPNDNATSCFIRNDVKDTYYVCEEEKNIIDKLINKDSFQNTIGIFVDIIECSLKEENNLYESKCSYIPIYKLNDENFWNESSNNIHLNCQKLIHKYIQNNPWQVIELSDVTDNSEKCHCCMFVGGILSK